MRTTFQSIMRHGNRQGTGILHFPKGKSDLFVVGEWLRVKLSSTAPFYARIVNNRGRKGIYVSKHIVQNVPLGTLHCTVVSQKGFYAPVAKDGTMYIPAYIISKHDLRGEDIVALRALEYNRKPIVLYRKLYVLQRKNRGRTEFIIRVPKEFFGRDLVSKLRKLSRYSNVHNPLLAILTKGMRCAFLRRGSLVIFRGNKLPAIVNPSMEWRELARYLGAYFSDGTKKGNSWAIAASTFLQARWYLKVHRELIKDASPECILVYTSYVFKSGSIVSTLQKQWEREIGQRIDGVRLIRAIGKRKNKWNKYGTLVIREHRQILLDVYRNLLGGLADEILRTGDKNLAWEFLFGILEGDGGAPATKRGHLSIATNDKEHKPIERILEKLQLRFKVIQEGSHKYCIRIGALELLRNFDAIKSQVFLYYPKRRQIFFERLNTVGAVRFFTEQHIPTNWVKSWLRAHDFVDQTYQLTPRGAELRRSLLCAMTEV